MPNVQEGLEDDLDVIIRDLANIALLLNDSSICPNTGPIDAAIYDCQSRSTEMYYCYSLNSLDFNPNCIYPPGGTLPLRLDNIFIRLSIEVRGRYMSGQLIDPLEQIEEGEVKRPPCCDLELYATNECNGELYSAWHFDKDFEGATNISGQTYLHPKYHWTFGGNRMEYTDLGGIFIFPAPRIAHPPFDAILAIDYIIKHFIPNEIHIELTSSSEYINIVARSQRRIWRPFILTLASFWTDIDNLSGDFTPTMILPELVNII